MTTIKSTSGKKAVNISKNNGQFVACYVQIDVANQREQLINMKWYKSEKSALKYANKVLN